MSSFLVRNAKPGDAVEVTRLVGAVDEAFIGRMVGYGTVEERPGLGRADGYVDPAQTGRGIGALLHDAFAKFRRLGKREAGLGVDATSTTGADRLYDRVGMHVHWAAVVFEKRIDA